MIVHINKLNLVIRLALHQANRLNVGYPPCRPRTSPVYCTDVAIHVETWIFLSGIAANSPASHAERAGSFAKFVLKQTFAVVNKRKVRRL